MVVRSDFEGDGVVGDLERCGNNVAHVGDLLIGDGFTKRQFAGGGG